MTVSNFAKDLQTCPVIDFNEDMALDIKKGKIFEQQEKQAKVSKSVEKKVIGTGI